MTPHPTPEQAQALDAARALASIGIPIFLAAPDVAAPTGYRLPSHWQSTLPDPRVLDSWHPGMAVCMVTGHGLDLLDVDLHKGGDVAALDGVTPISYGAATTPSGGLHSFIRSLGVRSRDAVLPGVDIKAGAPDGQGRGFAFIAPTIRISKSTGEPTPYRWAYAPDVSRLAAVMRGEVEDTSGKALAALIAEVRSRTLPVGNGGSGGGAAYDGPDFDDMGPELQQIVRQWVNGAVEGIRAELAASADWSPGQTDDRGRGWEKLQADAALRLGRLARARWNDLELTDVESVFCEAAPTDGTWGTDDVELKWRQQSRRLEPAAWPNLQTPSARDEEAWAALGLTPPEPVAYVTTEGAALPLAVAQAAGQGQPWAGGGAGHAPMPSEEVAARYFGPGGIQAATLAGDVLRLGPLRTGRDDLMWSYGQGVWSSDKHVVRDRLSWLMGQRFRTNYVGTVEAIIRANVETITSDPIPELVNFTNGLLDWRQGTLLPHSPDVPSTVQLAVPYNPDAACDPFEAFLASVVPPDMVETVWELIGYLMFSGNPLHKAVMLTGSGRNGKGTFLRVVLSLLGRRNVTSASLHDLVNTRFTTASLFGKLANIAGDIDAGYLENTAVFKQITGGDTISAEHKGRDRFDFEPWAVPMFSANRIPASADTSIGYLARWLVVPFPNSFLGREDRHLDAKLHRPEILQGVAARGIAALPRLLDRGDFDLTESGVEAREEFIRRVDQVRTWLADCCLMHPDYPFLARTELYAHYKAWAMRDGHKAVRAAEFYDRLEAAGAEPAKVRGIRGFRRVLVVDDGLGVAPGGISGGGPASGYLPSNPYQQQGGPVPQQGVYNEAGEGPSVTQGGQRGQAFPTDLNLSAVQGAEGAGISNWKNVPFVVGADGGQVGGQVGPELTNVTADPMTFVTGGQFGADLPAPHKTAGQVRSFRFGGAEGAGNPQPPYARDTQVGGLEKTCPLCPPCPPGAVAADGEPCQHVQAEPEPDSALFDMVAEPKGSGPKPAKAPKRPQTAAATAKRAEAAAAKLAAAVAEAEGGTIELPALVWRDPETPGKVLARTVTLAEAEEVLAAVLADGDSGGSLTVDVETTGYPVGHRDYALRTIQLGNEGLAIDLDACLDDHRDLAKRYLAAADELHAHSAPADLVPLADAGLIDADAAWDRMTDTATLAKLADPNLTDNDASLKKLAPAVLGDHAVTKAADAARAALFKAGKWLTDTEVTTPVERSGWAQVRPNAATMVKYATSDVLDAAAIARRLPRPTPTLLARERLAQTMTARISHRGLRLDGEHVWAKVAEEREGKARFAEQVRGFGVENPGSGPQVAQALIGLGAQLPRTAKGNPSVAAGVIESMRGEGEEPAGDVEALVRAVLGYRHHATALSLILEPFAALVEHGDSRVRPTIYTLGADTGRMSCVRQNLQQISRTGGLRACVTADPGELLISADFAGVELRVAAALSGDAVLRRMLDDGVDLHYEIAKMVYGPHATKAQRYSVKPMVFGRIYGGGVKTLAAQGGVSMAVAQQVIDALDTLLPGLAEWSRMVRQSIEAGNTQFPTSRVNPHWERTIYLDREFPHKGPNYCLTPDTPILRADLRHVPADQIRVGDRLVAFDEFPVREGGSPNKYHKMRTAVVEKVARVVESSVTVRAADGRATRCSANHLWLARPKTQPKGLPRVRWVRADELRPGDALLSMGAPWATDQSRTAGYLAGLYDGEGSLQARGEGSGATGLHFGQKPGAVMNHFISGMQALDLPHSYYGRAPRSTSPCDIVTVPGIRKIMRVLGTLQPERFKHRFENVYEGAAITAGLTDPVEVVGVDPAGDLELVSIQTSTRTLIANGFLSHNCIQGTARELLVDALERWDQTPWRDCTLLPVHDELVVKVPEADAAEATEALVQCMSTTLAGVPIVVEASDPSFAWADAA